MVSFLWGPRRGAQAYKPGSVPFRASAINLGEHVTMPLSRFLPSDSREQRSDAGLHGIAARSLLVSPRLSLSLPGKKRDLVSVAVTKHFCLTAVNRCGALCCPDFPHLSARQTGLLGAVYGNRTRLLGLGSRCTTDVLTPRACISTRATAGKALVVALRTMLRFSVGISFL